MYKRSFAQSLLRYATQEMGKKILEELHEGVCSSHIGGPCPRSYDNTIGYYWLSLQKNDMNLVRTYNKC